MPDKKYLIEIPGMPEGSGVWDSDKWERNKDAFMSDYPEANVFELGEYDAEDTNENDQIMLTFENDPDSSGVWDSAKWERNKEAFTADHPEAKVNRVRYVDYWGNAAQENRAKREELSQPDAERDARLAYLGYYDDMSGMQKDFSLENNTIGLKPVSSAIEQNSVSGEITYHDPKLAEFYANDSAHTERMAEIARLDAEYDSNPSVVAQREWEEERRQNASRILREAEESYKNLDHVAVSRYHRAFEGSPTSPKTIAKGMEDAAKDDAIAMAFTMLKEAETLRSGVEEGALKGFGKNLILPSTLDGEDYQRGQQALVKTFMKLQEAMGPIDQWSEEKMKELLTKEEMLMVEAFFELSSAQSDTGGKLSTGYEAGRAFAHSVPFMIQFMMSAGMSDMAAKPLAQGLTKMAAKTFAKKAGSSLVKRAVNTGLRQASRLGIGVAQAAAAGAVQTMTQSGTTSGVLDAMMQFDEDGYMNADAQTVATAYFDRYIENFSEGMGEVFGGIVGTPLKGAGRALNKAFKTTAFTKLGSAFGKTTVGKLGKAAGVQNGLFEMAEEAIGAAIRDITINEGAWEEFSDPDNLLVTALSFVPMTIGGGTLSLGQIGAAKLSLERSQDKMRKRLAGYVTPEQMEYIINTARSTSAESLVETMKPVLVGMQLNGASAEQINAVRDYMVSAARYQTMMGAEETKAEEQRNATREKLEQEYGKFYHAPVVQNKAGEQMKLSPVVRTARLINGQDVYIVSNTNDKGEFLTIDMNTKKKGMAKESDIAEQIDNNGKPKKLTMTESLNDFLSRRVMLETKETEAARMKREYQEQVDAIRSEIHEGTRINLGTEGSPVMLIATGKTSSAGVEAIDQNGVSHTIGWEQTADAMGTPIKVLTDSQIVEQEIADIVARDAERKAQRAQQKGDNAVAANEAVAEASETVDAVAQETKHIPLNEDGTVNEAAFWEQDPEGYAQWNDEQNQDGGADTIQQIEAAKAELTAMLNEAQQATLTSNPANRKAAKREAGRLAERLARLEALEQSYADRALAPLRERAKMWADLTGAPVHVIETEEELAAISATVASENAKPGSRVRGFAKDGKAYIFLPGIQDVREIDEVFFHEAVAHNGLKGLLGKENYDKLCEQVWNMMSPAARNQFIRYPGVNGDYRAAADEYIAHIAEKMGANIAEAEEKTIWQKIVDFVRNVLRAMGIELNVTEQELSDLLHQAYADLANNMAKAEQIATGEAMSAVEEAPSEARRQYDALLEDLTPEEVEAVAQNDFNAAQEAYNAHLANAPKVEPGESSKAYIERKKAYNDELKRLESELNAQQALMDEITAIKAANAPVLTDVEILEQDGFGVDEQHDDVRMSVRYTPTDEQKEAIINSIVNVTGRSREEAERWLASETSLAAMINDDLQYLDYVADPKYKAIKDNSDYPQGTVDFNNICRKRVPFTRMFTRLQRAFPNRVFTADELADIRTIMSKDGLTVACGLCYVEDRRQMVGEVAQSFIDGIQEGFETYANNPTKRKNAEKFKDLIGEDAYVPQVYDLTTQEGLDKLYNEHRGIWEAFQAFNNARGQQSQNLLQGYAEYKREILSWSDKKVKQVNDNGGLRIFSYSDFEAHHLIDVVQIIIDCASKGVKIQGYTKVPAFARAVANTGIKLNRSLIPLGDTGLVDGQLAFDPVEGIDINDPDFLESNDNVGNILIGINDEQIRVAMNDPRIHYIIPYHARQKENIRQKLNVGAWTNYISTQNERNVSDGKRVKDNINIYTDILTEDITTDRQFVEKYLQLCAEQGRIPKFDQFLDKDAEGNYVYTPGYYKFLIDFKLFDENGNILPQQPVVAEFDDAFNMQILEDYAKNEKESTGDQMNETYYKIVKTIGLDESMAEGEDVRFSKKTKAPETAVQPMAGHSTVVSSADGANVIKNLETLLEEYRNKPSNRQKTFIGDLARALGLRNNGNHSNYGTFEAVNGEVFTYRISDHNSSTKNMEDAGNPNGISIVITHRPNNKITKDGNAHIVEFYYNTQRLLNADGQPYADIIQSVIQSLYSGEYKDTTGLAEMDEAVSFSVITPQMDADYLAAVEAGDMETAQRMVNEAAKLAMPNTKVVDENGNPKVVYHGTFYQGNVFNRGFFAEDEDFARDYTLFGKQDERRLVSAFLNIENPRVVDANYANYDSIDTGREITTTDYLVNETRKDGIHDGLIVRNVDERSLDGNYWTDDYIPFSPSQIKSAEPVTYDDEGNVIPLSKRFNPANEDIRFSVRTDEQRQALFDKAKAQFGLTNNFKVAGYMLPDGSLLDFSEANNGGNPNQRSLDHREIEGIIMDEGKEYDSRWMYLADFMNEGAIRLLPEYAGINLMKAPTKEQRQKLFDFIYKYNGEVILEIADERLNNVAYVEYDRRTSPSRIFRDIDGYFNEGIVPEQDVRFSVRTVNQTAQEFHNDALTDFRRQFNLIQPTTVVDVNDRAALAEALGLTPEELSDEKYQLILDGVKDGGRSFYDDDTKRIAIFALEKQRTSAEVDENIFHENTHAIVSKNPEVLELGQWLWDNAKSGIRMKTRNSILDSNYPEWQYANEMLSRYTGIILSMGRAGEVLNMLPADQKKHWEFILKEFGYEPEREDGERIRRYDADSRRAGFFRKMSQQKMSDNGAAEKGTRFSSVGITPEVRDEMDRIAATAIIDGNYMLAPNGQPTKLTADQWALVRTGNFKRWFGDWENDPDNASKVVDENGEPIVVYHGTNLSVTNKGVPFWTFYEDQHFGTEEQAKELARAGRPEAERKMYEVFLNIRNIKRVPDVPQDWIKNHSEYWEPVFAQAKTEGYDGLVYVNEWEDSDSKSDSYVAFAPSQIKSATDNTGEFSSEEGDIRLSFKPVGGNSGYVGYSMSRRAAMARSEGRYPKTDFRKEYGVTSASLDALVYFDIIDNSEWHHTSVYGNKTTFYGWSEEEYADIYADNKKVIDGIAREFKKADEAYRNSGKELHERLVAGEITPQEVYELGREADRNHLRSIDEMRAKIDSIFNPSEEGDIRYSIVTDPADEIVAEGMKLSIQDFARLAGNIFQDMPESFRKEAIEETFKRGWDMQSAIFQIPARLAEKTEWTDEDKDLARIIREKVQDAVDESGAVSDRPLTTKEALWMLYRSTSENGDDLISAARRSLVAHNLGFDPGSERIREMADEHIRYSVVRNNMIDSATDMYNYEASLWTNRLKESWLDMNQSVISLQNALAEASGKPIEPWENLELALNQLSSRSYADKKKYMRDFLEPLWDVVLEIIEKTDYRIEDIERYMMLKHALERNIVFAKRDAREFYESAFRQQVTTIEGNKSLSDADKQLQIDKAQKALDKHLQDIDAGTDAKFLEFREKDYGGLTSMFVDFDRSAVRSRSSYKSEEAYQQAVIAATKPRFDNVADMENAARDEVDVIEQSMPVLSMTLWHVTRKATGEILRHQHASGMITTEQYDAVRNMFQHYVPLRGFADNTAEDMYSYYMNNSSNGFAMPIIGAKGRKTKAESPLGWIGTMAESAIQSDNKNDAKMRLYYALLNRPDTGVLSIAETWYEYTGQNDANGRKIFAPVYPPATGKAMTADELRQHMDTWEADMMQKRAAGNAFKGNQSVNLRGSVVFQDTKEDKEHVIRVKVAGKDYSILVNGNPRAAQAINGLLNPDANVGPVGEWVGNLRRNMSALMTSFSPLFWVSNYQRDLLSSFMRTSESEGWKQAFKYLNNRRKAWRVASYIYKNDKGRLGNSYYENLYKEFAENGGITGYTSLTTNKEYEKLLEEYAQFADKPTRKWIKNAWNNFMGFGEAIEQVSRFAAFITAREAGKSVEEAVNAAKEVSVNFNRKGSAKPLSLDEIDKLRTKDGKPLNKAQKAVAVVLTAMPKGMKELYFFFNASIQALSSSAKLAKQSPGKATAWAGMYMGLSMALAAINYLISGDDDEEEYLDLPDYARRSNALVKISDEYYLKWSLPQEMRPFYATADIILGKTAGNMPHKSVGKEIALAMAEWLPVNPFGTDDPLLSLVPDFAAPLAEIKANKNFVGGKIYDDMAFKSEGEKENIPAYRKATSKTGKIYVEVAEVLNAISGGDEVQKGAININPAVVEHLVEGYGGGLYDFAKMMVSFPAMLISDEDVEVRNIPFVNKVVMSVDETNMYTHTNEVFYHYRDIAENAERVEKEYRNSDDPSRADAYRQEEDWRIHQLFEQYDAELKEIKDKLKNAADKEEEDLLKQSQNAVRELLLNDIATGKEPDPVLALNDAVKEISKEISAIKKPYNDAEKKRKKAKESGDAEGARRAKAERDEIRKSDAYKTADKAGKDLKELKELLDEIQSTASPEDRDSLITKFNDDYQALKKKLESK